MIFKRKRKTLPKDFGEMLEKASLDELIAVFNGCELEATGGYSKQTALGFYKCPEALARWLVAQGADVNAPNSYGRTPLHERATSWLGGVELLLDLGAAIEARDGQGFTPLHAAAMSHKPAAVRALIQRGADVHSATQRGQADAGLARLYSMFSVTPVATRRVHDGTSPITVPGGPWRAQYTALWELLVPSQGPAATAQGEAVRITGRVSREILDTGGANWMPISGPCSMRWSRTSAPVRRCRAPN